MTEKYV